jgi:hypothetical protein
MGDLKTQQAGRVHVVTVVAIGIVVYGVANLLHEAVGHGGACLAVGCKPIALSSMHFQGDTSRITEDARRIIAAAGSLTNIVAAIPALLFLRARRASATSLDYAAWLFATVNLLQAAGYFLFSGVAGIGDWCEVVRGVGPMPLQRLSLTIAGGMAYWTTVRWSMSHLSGLIGGDVEWRSMKAYLAILPAYLAGATLYVSSGALNPGGIRIVLISAVAASLGGTSGLVWGPQLLKDPNANPASDVQLVVEPDPRWWLAAVAVLVPFVLWLGPGIE